MEDSLLRQTEGGSFPQRSQMPKKSKDATPSSREEDRLWMVLLQHSPPQPLLPDVHRLFAAEMGCNETRDQEVAQDPGLYLYHLFQGT